MDLDCKLGCHYLIMLSIMMYHNFISSMLSTWFLEAFEATFMLFQVGFVTIINNLNFKSI
jgi:hypothetical protein